MPQATQRTGKSLSHALFLAAALSLLSAWCDGSAGSCCMTARDRRKKVRVAPRRIAASLAFATLFFAGAALSAGAGNGVVALIDPSSRVGRGDTTTTTDTTTSPTRLGDSAASAPTPSRSRPGAGPASEPSAAAGAAVNAAPSVDGAPDAPQPVSQAVAHGTASNMNVAGVRSTLRRELRHAALEEAGRRSDRTRAAGPRPDVPRASPPPAGPACGQGDEGRTAPQASRPRARGGRAERGRHGLAVPRPTGSDAALAPSEAGLRPPARPRVHSGITWTGR